MGSRLPMNKCEKAYCRMCDHRCGIDVSFKDGYIDHVVGSKNHPLSKGKICVKAKAIGDYMYSPERLFKPLKKNNNNWEEISLKQALDEIAQKIDDVQNKYGKRSIGIWKGEAIGFNQQEDYARRFAFALQTPSYFSNDTQCSKCREIGFITVRGHYPIADLINSKCIIIWGANPKNSAPPRGRLISEARKNGAKLIVIGPKRSSTAKKADLFVQIKPATDGAFALGIINKIIGNRWYDEEFVSGYTVGFQELKDYAAKFSDEYVEKETGVSSSILNKVAKIYCQNSPRATILTGNGLEHCQNAANNIRAIACIGALTGCVDQPGGDFIPERPIFNSLRPDWNQVVQLCPIGHNKYPVLAGLQETHSLLAIDAMLDGKPYPIKGLIITGANPALTMRTQQSGRGFFFIGIVSSQDLFLTETATG